MLKPGIMRFSASAKLYITYFNLSVFHPKMLFLQILQIRLNFFAQKVTAVINVASTKKATPTDADVTPNYYFASRDVNA
jgi:hypothetical protein